MRKTVIANWGTEGQGKSNTIMKVARIILDKYPTSISNPKRDDIDFSADIKVVITIDKIKIGIESQGDPCSQLFKSLNDFVEKNCDLIICATRSNGNTVRAVEDLHYSYNYDIIWVTNYRSNEKDQEYLNELSAKHIFELIQNLLSNKI